MSFAARPAFRWQLRTRMLVLGQRTLLMGILNITPDSFSDGNLHCSPEAAIDHGLRLLDQGADLLDLGGESTRPGATAITAEEERIRLLPVLRGLLRARPDAILSVDTYHAATAQTALGEGAEIVNDVSGLLWDPAMAEVLADAGPGAILMHTRGTPAEWKTLPPLPQAEVMPLVLAGLSQSLRLAEVAGIPPETIVLDPGFGFGKLGEENFALLAGFGQLACFSLPLLAGVSRKRFLVAPFVAPTDALRLQATSAAHVAILLAGAHILRVHDVPAARTAATIADAILARTSVSRC